MKPVLEVPLSRRNGMTIMSVVVAASLAGIVALAVGRLISGQAETMTTVKLREERETLLKHYKSIVVSGWDSTRGGSCTGVMCDRRGSVVIPYANGSALYLPEVPGSGLYDYGYTGETADRWWKVSIEESSLSGGSVLQADSYAKPDDLVAVTVKVEFIRTEHPTVKTILADREEIVFLHHNTAAAIGSNDTDCEDGHHLTQMNSSGSALYSGTGAIIQYDFNSNYTKCSQVPLVNTQECGSGALIGFFRKLSTDTPARTLITGSAICSTTHHNSTPTGYQSAEIRGNTEKRTVKAKDCSGSGYVKRMGRNENPVCVNPRQGEKVAAESRPRSTVTKDYTVRYLSDPGPPARYTSATCSVTRTMGIKGFNNLGEPEYWHPAETTVGTQQGVPGPTGVPGVHNGPPGPPGMCRRPYCCQHEYRTYSGRCGDWYTDRHGRRRREWRNDCREYVRTRTCQ